MNNLISNNVKSKNCINNNNFIKIKNNYFNIFNIKRKYKLHTS